MSLSCSLIELSITILAFCPIIILLYRLLRRSILLRSWASTSLVIWSRCSHGSSEHFALSFPLCCFSFSSFDGLVHFIGRLLLLFRRIFCGWLLFIEIILIGLVHNFSLLFNIKCFPLLYKDLHTNLRVLLKSLITELPSTCRTLNPVLIVILFRWLEILFTRFFINVLLLFYCMLIRLFILIKVLWIFFFFFIILGLFLIFIIWFSRVIVSLWLFLSILILRLIIAIFILMSRRCFLLWLVRLLIGLLLIIIIAT